MFTTQNRISFHRQIVDPFNLIYLPPPLQQKSWSSLGTLRDQFSSFSERNIKSKLSLSAKILSEKFCMCTFSLIEAFGIKKHPDFDRTQKHPIGFLWKRKTYYMMIAGIDWRPPIHNLCPYLLSQTFCLHFHPSFLFFNKDFMTSSPKDNIILFHVHFLSTMLLFVREKYNFSLPAVLFLTLSISFYLIYL